MDTVCRYKANHVFLDGYLFDCPASDHGHEPGILSAEPICDGFLDIIAALRKACDDTVVGLMLTAQSGMGTMNAGSSSPSGPGCPGVRSIDTKEQSKDYYLSF